MTPGQKVLKKFGEGAASYLADQLELNRSTVSRWAKSVEDGGTGGVIPAKYHKELIALGKLNEIKLTAEDLI